MTRFAFAGRCSTEDLQDPETSRNWQLTRARTLVEPTGGDIVAEYFDAGHSRALPWQRRPQAAALLQALRDPHRGFDAVVIGEPQRTFYGNQFGNTFPLFVHFGVPLWVPEIGGPIDPKNEAHDLVMSVFGGMSKGERNRIKIRVHTAMASQAKIEGRYLGGRPPYGYRIADAGPHPNPAKAADGKRLHRLEPDPETAPVVVRIFTEYLRGKGDYAIAEGLTRHGILCPSAHDRARNPHRDGHAWSKSAVRAILINPRYTGHEVWNKQRKDEVLLDIDDVTLGHRSKLTWNAPDQWIWSTHPVHEPLVTMDTFARAQARRHKRSQDRTAERSPRTTTRPYALRGRIRCSLCQRKMQGTFNHGHPHYRCRYPSEYAKSEAFDHPLAVYVREALILGELDNWIATVFAPGRLKATLHAMQQSQRAHIAAEPDLGAARRAIAECDRRLAQYRAALDAGANPTTVAGWISQAEADKAAAQHQLATARAAQRTALTDEQITHMIKALGDLTDRLLAADPGGKAPIYEEFGLELTYNATKRAVTVESQPASPVYLRTCPRGDLNPHAR
ncbi:recombinase family protein [Streptomyces noursei]|uniref:recombinase family protein n=2 Tax=Streptomyces noursei TaxID=1971 RepID=UPI000407B3F8|nr:recombinase family protein [Streptomyces noursei]UWS75370.1 recombinase family protein [Streptomyces noursei]